MKMTTECVEWNGALNSGGYPVTWKDGKTTYAHRNLTGAKLNQVVMHLCDNPRCVRLEHLLIGTHAENSADMVKKNRQAVGEECGNSKLKSHDILAIRSLQGEKSSRKVAALFNISKTNVLDIWKRKIWRHID